MCLYKFDGILLAPASCFIIASSCPIGQCVTRVTASLAHRTHSGKYPLWSGSLAQVGQKKQATVGSSWLPNASLQCESVQANQSVRHHWHNTGVMSGAC